MFGLGLVEIVVIVLVIILVVKPEQLPGFFKKIFKGYHELKKTVTDVKDMKDEFIRLADQVDGEAKIVKKQVDKIALPKSVEKIKKG